MGELLYYVGSILVVILSIWAAILAYRAKEKGLTYSSMAATVWAMSILAVGRTWHAIYEFWNIPHAIGDVAEVIEYGIYVVAYCSFIWLMLRVRTVKDMPKSSTGSELK